MTESGHVKIAVQLDEDTARQVGVGVESLWASATSDPLVYRVESIPFLASGISFGDAVRVTLDNQRLWLSERIAESGNSTVAIWVDEEEKVKEIRDALRQAGCESEKLRRQMFSVNIPASVELESVRDLLDSYPEDSLAYWERSVSARHGGPQ